MKGWREILGRPEIRSAEDLRPVLRDSRCSCCGTAYYMYRDLARTRDDRSWLNSRHIRFDITIIPPGTLCGEYVKTKGHYHPENDAGVSYPEIYEVLEGCAHFLLQRRDLGDIVLIDAKSGDVVLVPPGYGHVTINPGEEELVMANIVSSGFSSDYDYYEKHAGAAYYELAGGHLEKNARYPSVPQPRRARAGYAHTRLHFRSPLYGYIERKADILGFLNHPENYPEI